VALVDELAHNHVPGSHKKSATRMWLELLDAGINVLPRSTCSTWTASTIWFGRGPAWWFADGADSFLKRADQVVNLDLAVEDLPGTSAHRQDLRG